MVVHAVSDDDAPPPFLVMEYVAGPGLQKKLDDAVRLLDLPALRSEDSASRLNRYVPRPVPAAILLAVAGIVGFALTRPKPNPPPVAPGPLGEPPVVAGPTDNAVRFYVQANDDAGSVVHTLVLTPRPPAEPPRVVASPADPAQPSPPTGVTDFREVHGADLAGLDAWVKGLQPGFRPATITAAARGEFARRAVHGRVGRVRADPVGCRRGGFATKTHRVRVKTSRF